MWAEDEGGLVHSYLKFVAICMILGDGLIL